MGGRARPGTGPAVLRPPGPGNRAHLPVPKGSQEMTTDVGDVITGGRTALGIELGSTRIKAVLIGPDQGSADRPRSRPARGRQPRLGEPVRRPAVDVLAGGCLGRGAAQFRGS